MKNEKMIVTEGGESERQESLKTTESEAPEADEVVTGVNRATLDQIRLESIRRRLEGPDEEKSIKDKIHKTIEALEKDSSPVLKVDRLIEDISAKISKAEEDLEAGIYDVDLVKDYLIRLKKSLEAISQRRISVASTLQTLKLDVQTAENEGGEDLDYIASEMQYELLIEEIKSLAKTLQDNNPLNIYSGLSNEVMGVVCPVESQSSSGVRVLHKPSLLGKYVEGGKNPDGLLQPKRYNIKGVLTEDKEEKSQRGLHKDVYVVGVDPNVSDKERDLIRNSLSFVAPAVFLRYISEKGDVVSKEALDWGDDWNRLNDVPEYIIKYKKDNVGCLRETPPLITYNNAGQEISFRRKEEVVGGLFRKERKALSKRGGLIIREKPQNSEKKEPEYFLVYDTNID